MCLQPVSESSIFYLLSLLLLSESDVTKGSSDQVRSNHRLAARHSQVLVSTLYFLLPNMRRSVNFSRKLSMFVWGLKM